MTKEPGLSCPVCNFFICVSMEDLLSNVIVICPGCGLELQMKSKERKPFHEREQNLITTKEVDK